MVSGFGMAPADQRPDACLLHLRPPCAQCLQPWPEGEINAKGTCWIELVRTLLYTYCAERMMAVFLFSFQAEWVFEVRGIRTIKQIEKKIDNLFAERMDCFKYFLDKHIKKLLLLWFQILNQ